jgi:very-long-chain (3R)-3-hydroxyacyl-CoA dehydratase
MAPPAGRLRTYLLAYNAISLALWATLTLRLLLLLPPALFHPSLTLSHVHHALYPLLLPTQSLALLEVVHSLLGLVRAPLMTTSMQVASRLLVVWGVLGLFPQVVVGRSVGGIGKVRMEGVGKGKYGDLAECGALIAWGVTECVRYGFFVAQLWGGDGKGRVPGWLSWARYNTFFVLYPLGIASECWLVYLALGPAGEWWGAVEMGLRGVLLVYVPGMYSLLRCDCMGLRGVLGLMGG